MSNRDINIKSTLDISLWENLQDTLSGLSGAAIMCVDLRGIPVSKYSGCSDFCAAVMADAQMRERCQRCAALAGLEAARLETPFVCKCHCGIVEAAIPVIADDTYLGSVLFGQMRLSPKDEKNLTQLVNETSNVLQDSGSNEAEMRRLFSAMPEMSLEDINKYVNYIDALVKYTVRRSFQSDEAKDYETSFFHRQDAISPDFVPSDCIIPKTSPLFPAVRYVHEHLCDNITMKDMAILCHLSPSYFSRLFSREARESFVSYVNRNKVELAKTMLRESNRSISQISSDIGFHDTSHFISLFKRFEGTTPTVYRQINCR